MIGGAFEGVQRTFDAVGELNEVRGLHERAIIVTPRLYERFTETLQSGDARCLE